MNDSHLFICFAAEDRYTIAEPIVYHLKNYGINIWYDRYAMVMGDNREEKNLKEGAGNCQYAVVILSKNTYESPCAMEEISIIQIRCKNGEVTVFPVLYELTPENLPNSLSWIKELIFKEATRKSGTREICNHIACKITGDIIKSNTYKSIGEILISNLGIPIATNAILESYSNVDASNINSRISLLYAAYLTLIYSIQQKSNYELQMIDKIFKLLFSETRLCLKVDYRELWLLENSISILVGIYLDEFLLGSSDRI
jgi:hypothetical protein